MTEEVGQCPSHVGDTQVMALGLTMLTMLHKK